MAFADLRTFHDPNLHLPIGGNVYTIMSPSPSQGIRLRRLFAGALSSDAAGELEEMMSLLGATKTDDDTYEGGVYREMADNGVPWEEIEHAGLTALMRYGQNAQVAETFWLTGGSVIEPEQEPKPAAKKAAPRKATARKSTPRKKA